MVRKDSIDEIKETLLELKERVDDVEGTFENKVGEFKNKVKENVVEAEKKVKHKIGEYPFQSVGIAFGSGLLIGMVAYALIRKK